MKKTLIALTLIASSSSFAGALDNNVASFETSIPAVCSVQLDTREVGLAVDQHGEASFLIHNNMAKETKVSFTTDTTLAYLDGESAEKDINVFVNGKLNGVVGKTTKPVSLENLNGINSVDVELELTTRAKPFAAGDAETRVIANVTCN